LKGFIIKLSKSLNFKYSELIEKDLLLSTILFFLSKNAFFYKNLLFKGGTCLIKNYLGYYRFSEDIDFTWKDQSIFKNKSKRESRSCRSNLINKIGKVIEDFCKEYNCEFINDKSNADYFEFGGGNKRVTLKLYYKSEVLDIRTYIKIQINFVETLMFEHKTGILKSVIPENEELISSSPEEYSEYLKEIRFPVYDIKEILYEKIRAILTREGRKGRDFLDIYMILKKNDFNIKEMKNQIIKKILFSVNKFDKYKENFKMKLNLIKSYKLFTWGEEKRFLLVEIDEEDFSKFLAGFNIFLKEITEKIYEKIA